MKYNLKYKNWDDITIEVFQQIQNVVVEEGEEVLDKNIKIASILYDCDPEVFYNISIDELGEVIKSIDFLSKPPKFNLKRKYVVNGHKYLLEPNINKFSVGQYMDYQNYLKMEKNNTHLLLSVFLIPEGYDKYNIGYDMKTVLNDMRKMSILDVNGITSFFSVAFAASFKVILQSSVKQLKKLMKKEKNEEKRKALAEAIEKMKEISIVSGV